MGGSIEARSKFALDVIDAVVARVGRGKDRHSVLPVVCIPGHAHGRPRAHVLVISCRKFASAIRTSRTCISSRATRPRAIHSISRGKSGTLVDPSERRESSSAAANTHRSQRSSMLRSMVMLSSSAERSLRTPTLVRRIRENIPLAPVDANVFYTKMEARGYVDYPFAEQKVSAAEVVGVSC